MQWQADLEARIASLTPSEVGAALARHLDPNKLVIVAARDFGATGGEAKEPASVQ